MKWSWSNLFGSSDVEIADEPQQWRTVSPAQMEADCTVETRMVTDGDRSRVEMIMCGGYGDVIVRLNNVAAVDMLIGQLITMRDLLEKVDKHSTRG